MLDKRRTRAHTLNAHVPRRTFQVPLTSFTQFEESLRIPVSPRILKSSPASSAASLELNQTHTRPPSRTRSSTNELGAFVPPDFLFTPADTPPAYTPTPSSPPPAKFTALKSKSSPILYSVPPLSTYNHGPRRCSAQLHSESEADDPDDDGVIHAARSGSIGNLKASGSSTGLRTRIFGIGSSYASSRHRDRPKTICTTPGEVCAGETETEIDEPPKHLPTARIIPSSGPLVPPGDLQQRLTPLLFEFSRLLSIVPAIFGTLYNLYHIYQPPPPRLDGRSTPERVDFAISALWAILTGYQCLCLTTGLLTRWRLYYPPLPTLIRLLALQGICWPATQLTCTILEHQKRPVIVWAVIATTTCVSRGVQIWVTSNLWWETREVKDRNRDRDGKEEKGKSGYWKRWGGGKWGGRRWDWKEVGVKCVLPAGIVYFIMAWAEQLRREFSGR
ncbi:hypothetical protein D9615_008648 [Tricholomella constricta]|uniref:N-glycosylation protein EOS1 n=1 Tax=Tricholomella constricta TaxID=117010 RepID=A0A8H5H492_9AGAR|nr:hypothetical protein D9615_008648 [Tricholomella constricta]